jgi:hypothetical protein
MTGISNLESLGKDVKISRIDLVCGSDSEIRMLKDLLCLEEFYS